MNYYMLQVVPPGKPDNPGGGNGNSGGAGCNNPNNTCVPMDGGIALIICLGLIFGIFQLMRERYKGRKYRFK